MKFKNIALVLGITAILGIFIGFFSYQLGQTISPADYEKNEQIMSFTALIIGSLCIALPVMYKKLSNTVEGGLIGGGVIGLIIAVISYWSYLTDWFRIIVVGLVALILIYLGMTKIKG